MKIRQRINRWFGKTTVEETVPTAGKMPEGYIAPHMARDLVRSGSAREGLWTDQLIFEGEQEELRLPRKLKVRRLEVRSCPGFRALPEELYAQDVSVANCPNFEVVPESAWAISFRFDRCPKLLQARPQAYYLEVTRCPEFRLVDRYRCDTLNVLNCALEELPAGVRASGSLYLQNCRFLRRVSNQELGGILDLRGCERLEYLPDELRATELNLAGCTALKWQDWADVEVARIDLRDCQQIRMVPDWLTVTEEIDVANTGLAELPPHLKECQILWRDTRVNERIAFRPETIQPKEILRERNSEVRRVMLERVGWERFFAEVQPKVVNRDRDPGGERLLLEFEFEGDFEPAVILAVQCPSTARKYFIRVPPNRRTCHAAAAWIAGFDNPDDYQTVIET